MSLFLAANHAAGDEDEASKVKVEAGTKPEAVLMQAKIFSQDKPLDEFIKGSPWEAWIFILEHPGGADAFERILDDAKTTLAGKIYALCGLYFCDHVRFEKKLEVLRTAPRVMDNVIVQHFDLFDHVPFYSVIDFTDPRTKAARLWYGESLADYVARTHELPPLDVAGGGIPVRLLDEGWLHWAGMVDFKHASVEDGMDLVLSRELFYRRWQKALKLNAQKESR